MHWLIATLAIIVVVPLVLIGIVLMTALYISIGGWMVDWDIWGKIYQRIKRQDRSESIELE